jgi:hypothetical protein
MGDVCHVTQLIYARKDTVHRKFGSTCVSKQSSERWHLGLCISYSRVLIMTLIRLKENGGIWNPEAALSDDPSLHCILRWRLRDNSWATPAHLSRMFRMLEDTNFGE